MSDPTDPTLAAHLHGPAGQATLQRIATLAHRAGTAAADDPEQNPLRVDGLGIAALPGSMCCRFVRQVHEGALHLPDHGWPFASRTAAETEGRLKRQDRRITGPIPGAVGCWDDGDVGHIAIDCGGGLVAENTGSHRGHPSRPGTKLTKREDVVAAHGGDPGRWYYAGPL